MILILSILVFITMGVFVLLFDVTSSYRKQLNDFAQTSRFQNVTIDLNINSKGGAPAPSQGGPFFETQRVFEARDSIDSNLNLSFKSKFIPTREILPEGVNNEFVDSKLFEDVFNGKKNVNNLVVDYQNHTISVVNQPLEIALYEKRGIEFTNSQVVNSSLQNRTFTITQPLFLRDVATINSNTGKEAFLSSLGSLYINIATNEVTTNVSTSFDWEDRQELYIVKGEQLARLLGFSKRPDGFYYYQAQNEGQVALSPNLSPDADGVYRNIRFNTTFAGSFNLQGVIPNSLASNKFLNLPVGTVINLATKDITRTLARTVYEFNDYKLNFDANFPHWTGTYLSAIKEILENPGNNIDNFYYWEKKRQTFIAPFSSQIDLDTKPQEEIVLSINKNDFNEQLFEIGSVNQFPTNIAELSDIGNVDILNNNDIFALTNKNIERDRFNFIVAKATDIATKNIIQEAKRRYDNSNLGYRETMTLTTINADNSTSVFHFVNAGDNNQVINGIKQNVGKLYNEEKNKSTLFTLDSANDPFFQTRDLNANISAKVIANVLNNLHADERYLKISFDYARVTFLDKNGENRVYSNGKIVRLKKTDGQVNADELGAVRILAPRGNDNFYIVKKIGNTWSAVDNQILDFVKLENYLNDNQLTVDSQTTGKFWAGQDDKDVSLINLPFSFATADPIVINEVLTKGTFETLLTNVRQLLRRSSLFQEGFISESTILAIVDSAKKSAIDNRLIEFIATGVGNNNIVPKFAFDTINYMIDDYGEEFLKNIFRQVINKMKSDYLNSGRTVEERNAFLEQQFNNLLSLVTGVSGSAISDFLPLNLNIGNLLGYFRDPNAIFDFLLQFIDSFNLKAYSDVIQLWYQNNWQKVVDGGKILLSSVDTILPLFATANDAALKESLLKLIDQVNFNKVLNPNLQGSIYNKFRQVNGADIEQLKTLFLKLNGAKGNQEPYSNVGEGLKEIVSLIDLKTMVFKIRDLATFDEFVQEGDERPFRILNITPAKVGQAILSSIFQRNSDPESSNADTQFKLALVKLLNLSDAGEHNPIINAYIPNLSDPNKLGIQDIGGLGSLGNLLNAGQHEEVTPISEQQILNELDNQQLSPEAISVLRARFPQIANFTISNYPNIRRLFVASQRLNDELTYKNSGTNFATIVHLLTRTNLPQDLIYQQAAEQINGAAPFSVFDAQGEPIPGIGSSFFEVGGFFMLLKNQYLGDNETFKNQYRKIFSLFATDSNNKFTNEFTKILNSNNLFSDQSANSQFSGLEVSRALSSIRRFTKYAFDEDPTFKNFLDSLNPETKKLINDNQELFIFNIATIASLKDNSIVKYSAFIPASDNEINKRSQNLFTYLASENNSFDNNRELSDLAADTVHSVTSSVATISSLELSPALLLPLSRSILPQVVLWYISDLNFPSNGTDDEKTNRSNLAYLITNKVVKFNSLREDELAKLSGLIFGNNSLATSVERDDVTPPVFDYDLFLFLGINGEPSTDQDTNFFGIDVKQLLFDGFNSITSFINDAGSIGGRPGETALVSFYDSASYVAKVNDAYLQANDKTVYSGPLPNNVLEFEKFLQENKNASFILNVQGADFIIVGSDATSDYIYPVIDENNIQVNSTSQAIIYVNNKGFARANNLQDNIKVKRYLIVHDGSDDVDKNVAEMSDFIHQNALVDRQIRPVIKSTELDPLNPERHLRQEIPVRTIRSIENFTAYTVPILALVVLVALLFVVKRYIQSKSVVLGIFLALGYRPIQIAFALTSFAVVTSILGGILGYIVGNQLQSSIMQIFSNQWSLPIQTTGFNFGELLISILVPFVLMSILIIFTTLSLLKWKSTELMSEAHNLNLSKPARSFYRAFSKGNIKVKYSVSLFINSFWKLLWVLLSFSLSSFVIMFAIASRNVFNKAINVTTINRNFSYRFNLASPTTEGGTYGLVSLDDLDNNLFVPKGRSEEIDFDNPNYFRQGHSLNINGNPGDNFNGIPSDFDAHVLSLFSSNITFGGNSSLFNPQQLILDTLPDALRIQALDNFQEIGRELQGTQYGKNKPYQLYLEGDPNNIADSSYNGFSRRNIYGTLENPRNYFTFATLRGQEGFYYARYNSFDRTYGVEPISVTAKGIDPSSDSEANLRDIYREFLINSGREIYLNDNNKFPFLISFAGVPFDSNLDETFTYLSGSSEKLNDPKVTVYGYKNNSSFNHLVDDSDNNLYEKLTTFNKPDVLPIVVNFVSATKHKLKVGDQFDYQVTNHVNRFREQILGQNIDHSVTFEVVGINNTFINEEYITTQENANTLVGLDPTLENSFNGLVTLRNSPAVVNNNVTLYSPAGYYGLSSSFVTDSLENKQLFFDRVFGSEGILLKRDGFSEAQILNWLNLNGVNSLADVKNNENQLNSAVQTFSSLYNNSAYTSGINDFSAPEIEAGFTETVTNAASTILNNMIIVTISLSILILILVSTIMIQENERNIALFSILGYTNKEKWKLFFTVFIPFIVLSIFVAIGLVFASTAIFNNFLLTSSIAVPLTLSWWNVIITFVAVLAIFLFSTFASWTYINKIKPILLMKGTG